MRAALLLVLLLAAVLATPAAAQRGEDLYGRYCARCHGGNGAGLQGRGPSLQGVGARAADFYLRTGYMPLRDPNDQPWRHRSILSESQLDALVRYVAALGGGPPVPKPRPERGDVSEGMRLFTDHCAGCHQVAGAGGIVTGARVPSLARSSPVEIAEAVRIGPYVMPRFSRKQISDRELDSIVRYVDEIQSPHDAGGWPIGHLGPISEGLVAWLVGGAALVLVAAVIGRRVRR
jgi:ubiquinol-cytochrome c reductase cytochrome c subunit